MNAIAHGVDIVEVRRIADMLERHPDRFVERCFTPDERAYCDSSAKRRVEHYAARFAAKEATLKAIGTGWGAGIGWRDIEIVRDPSGAPGLRLDGAAAVRARRLGIGAWLVSLSHTGEQAIASVIGLGETGSAQPPEG